MKTKLLSLFTISLLITCSTANAGKYDFMVGGYSYTANVAGKKTSLSGFGSYEAAYLHPFKKHFEFNLGYSLTMTGIVGGDYSYGPKLGLNYFPFNFSSNEKILVNDTNIQVMDFFKPYIGIAFNQRQFQSAKASYAGLGLSIGCEKYINSNYTIKAEVKMNTYTGSAEATATEMNALIGLVLGF